MSLNDKIFKIIVGVIFLCTNQIFTKKFIKRYEYEQYVSSYIQNVNSKSKSLNDNKNDLNLLKNNVIDNGINIIVNKKNVLHAFVPFDKKTDHFVRQVFSYWENETFEIFDQVKNADGIAIDLGAWIGTTSIWLSNNFRHVVAVEADQVSLYCLRNNLNASGCLNVTICERPVAALSKKMVFGPRENTLNQSTSFIKDVVNNVNDYSVRGINFKQLIHDYVYKNDSLKNKNISFIKCDIEGGEEVILEDVLYFAYHNNVKVYMSFHYDWWKNKNLKDFEYLFKFFKTNCSAENIVSYIEKNPFASILFEPIIAQENLIKRNMPAVIIGYNQPTYIKNMVSQLEQYTKDIIVIDNNSSFQPLLDYYEHDFKYTLLRQEINYGHKVYIEDFIQKLVGDVYILTDPDLEFNQKLPNNFIDILLEISNHFKAYKVGFALFIDSDEIRTDILFNAEKVYTLKQWESKFWQKQLSYPKNLSLILYEAFIDTTFCLINKKFVSPSNGIFKHVGNSIRVAGNYTCLHLPWFKNYKETLMPGEYENYFANNVSTNSFR